MRASQAIWKAMEAKGDLYLDRYEGWYSVRDEAFYDEKRADRRAKGARNCRRRARRSNGPSRKAGSSACRAISSRLLDHYAATIPTSSSPDSRRNEVLRFVEGGLSDLSDLAHQLRLGGQGPGQPDHVMYVWLDALTNYLTGVGYPDGGETVRALSGRPTCI